MIAPLDHDGVIERDAELQNAELLERGIPQPDIDSARAAQRSALVQRNEAAVGSKTTRCTSEPAKQAWGPGRKPR